MALSGKYKKSTELIEFGGFLGLEEEERDSFFSC
jgi:hypothetical protein